MVTMSQCMSHWWSDTKSQELHIVRESSKHRLWMGASTVQPLNLGQKWGLVDPSVNPLTHAVQSSSLSDDEATTLVCMTFNHAHLRASIARIPTTHDSSL